MSKAVPLTLRTCTRVQRTLSTRRPRRSPPDCCSAALAALRGQLVRRDPRLSQRNGGALRLRTAKDLRPRVYSRCLRPKTGIGLAPRRGGGLGAASQPWHGWTPSLPIFGCLRAMPWAWLQRSAAFGIDPRGRPAALRSRAPALRAAAGRRACAPAAWPGSGLRPTARDVRLAGFRRPDSLLAPSKRVPASKPSRGGGLRPPLRDRRPWGRLALGDGLRPAGASLVAPPPATDPLGAGAVTGAAADGRAASWPCPASHRRRPSHLRCSTLAPAYACSAPLPLGHVCRPRGEHRQTASRRRST